MTLPKEGMREGEFKAELAALTGRAKDKDFRELREETVPRRREGVTMLNTAKRSSPFRTCKGALDFAVRTFVSQQNQF